MTEIFLPREPLLSGPTRAKAGVGARRFAGAGRWKKPRVLERFLGVIILWFALVTPSFAQELLKESFSRELTVNVGGGVDFPQATSRELTVNFGGVSTEQIVGSREVSVIVASAGIPQAITSLAVHISPTGETATLDWSSYSELAQRDVVRYAIYRSDHPFSDVSAMTPVVTIFSDTFSYTFSGLPAFQDQYFAVVPIDVTGKFVTAVNYAASYVLSPETASREYTLNVGGGVDFPQAISRAVSVVVGSNAAPDAIGGIVVTVTPDGQTVTLDWRTYVELAQRDIVRYDIYVSDHLFTTIGGLTPTFSVPAETQLRVIDGLTAGRDYFFAVVPVDSLGHFVSTINYAVATALSAEVISRELTIQIGGVPDFPQAVSRELSILVPTSSAPDPVTGLTSGFTAVTSTSAYRAVDLDWSTYNEVAQRDIIRYRVYVGSSYFEDVTGQDPFVYVPANTLHATVTGLASRGIYYFAVVAEDLGGHFNPSVRAVSAQATVAGVGEVLNLAAVSEDTALTFTWSAPEGVGGFLTGYRLYFAGATTPISLASTATSYRATGLSAAHGYSMRIATVDIFGNESSGVALLASTLLPNPTGLSVTPVDRGVSISWTGASPPELVLRYAVYVSTSPISSLAGRTPAALVTTTAAFISGLTNGTTYYFAVATVNSSGGTTLDVISVSAVPLPDAIGPRVVATTPSGSIAGSLSTIDVQFSEAIDPASVVLSEVSMTGPFGAVAMKTITQIDATTFRLGFDSQLYDGAYTLRVGPRISDLSGNLMDQDRDGMNGEPLEDVFTTTLTLAGLKVPDLAVERVSITGTGALGSTAVVTWRLHNLGTGPATGPWTDQILLSSDGTAFAAVPIGTSAFAGTLAAGATIDRTFTFTVTASGLSGALQAVVTTDVSAQVAETSETNNTALSSTVLEIPLQLTLALSRTTISESDGANAATGTVQRNGDLSSALVVSLSSSDASSASSATSVTLLAGQTSATFAISTSEDLIVEGTKTVQFTAAAVGYPSALAMIDVLDTSRSTSALTLSVADAVLLEGDTRTVTVTRGGATDSALTVMLASSNLTWISAPTSVVIPAGATAVSFSIASPQNTVIETDRAVTLTADAAAYSRATLALTVIDDDTPALSLSLNDLVISENAGPVATYGTVTRDLATLLPVTVSLTNSNPAAVTVPGTVTIAAGAREARFNVGANDNTSVDGDHVVTIGARIISGGTALATAAPVSLTVLDDDTPRLVLELPRDVVGEGLAPAITAVVHRPTADTSALTVTISSSDPSIATAPASVVIPAGTSSVGFEINTIDNGVIDGNRVVTFRVDASGLGSSEHNLIVSDSILPDLVVTRTDVSSGSSSATSAMIVIRVENQGLATAHATTEAPWHDRIYLSKTGSLADAILVADQTYDSDLAVGAGYDNTFPIRLPTDVGDYYVIFVTDADKVVGDVTRTNNLRVGNTPIHVGTAYSSSVKASLHQALAGTPITFSGHATLANGTDFAASVVLNLHVYGQATHRIVPVTTDSQGNFTLLWTPLPGEAGHFQIGAAYPSLAEATIQDEFDLVALTVSPSPLVVSLAEGQSIAGTLILRNLSDLPLSGLTLTAHALPPGLAFLPNLPAELPRLGEISVPYVATAQPGSNGAGTFSLTLSSASGISYSFPVGYVIQELKPRLSSDAFPSVSMVVGESRTVNVTVTNSGGASTGALKVFLPNAPWLGLATPSDLPPLAPGASFSLGLLLSPSADLALLEYTGAITIQGATLDEQLTLPFNFRAVSEKKGSLLVTTIDEYFYFATGQPKLAGAQVSLLDPYTSVSIGAKTTGPDGAALFENLPSGYYQIEVRADRHATARQTLFVEPGRSNAAQIFTSFQPVSYSWTVTPTDVQDHYRLEVQTTFETNVPIPVVVVTPGVFDLESLKTVGQKIQINMNFTNHGLIAAENVVLHLPTLADHPYYKFSAATTELGTLGAMASITVPVVIERVGGADNAFAQAASPLASAQVRAAESALPCSLSGEHTHSYKCGGKDVSGGGTIPASGFDRGDCGTSGSRGTSGGSDGNGHGGSSVSSVPIATATPEMCPKPIVKIAIDANRDGKIEFTAADTTSKDKPFRFWPNDDREKTSHEDVVTPDYAGAQPEGSSQYNSYIDEDPSLGPDFDRKYIAGPRDLEDYIKIGVSVKGVDFKNLSKDAKITLHFEGGDASTQPLVNVFFAHDQGPEMSYLKNPGEASVQCSTDGPDSVDYSRAIGRGSSVDVTQIVRAHAKLSDQVYFLAEFLGTGPLHVSVEISDGSETGSTNDLKEGEIGKSVELDIESFKRFYRHWTVGDYVLNGVVPREIESGIPGPDGSVIRPLAEIGGNGKWLFDSSTVFTFVHGWRLQSWERIYYGETLFKRLYWKGAKCNFALYSWPTDWLDINALREIIRGAAPMDSGARNYILSEAVAWRSAAGLQQLISEGLGGKTVKLVAHSMGNYVTGEALRNIALNGGPRVDSYLMMNPATVASMYNGVNPDFPFYFDDPTTLPFGPIKYIPFDQVPFRWTFDPFSFDPVSPDHARGYFYPIRNGVNSPITMYWDRNDAAMTSWIYSASRESKSATAPGFGFKRVDPMEHYIYNAPHLFSLDADETVKFYYQDDELDFNRPLDRYDIFAHLAQPYSQPAGAAGDNIKLGASAVSAVWESNLSFSLGNLLGSDPEAHSSQFLFDLASTSDYYEKLIADLALPLSH